MVCLPITSLTPAPITLFLARFALVILASSLFLKHSQHIPFSDPLLSLILFHIHEAQILASLIILLPSGLYSQGIFLVSPSLTTLSKGSFLAPDIL